jgi:hypothetical protein
MEFIMNRLFIYVAILVVLSVFLVSGVNAGDLSAEYLHGRWAIDTKDCSSPNSEYLEFRKNGTFQSDRAGQTEVVGFWELNRDRLEMHMLTSPAFFDDIHKALSGHHGRFDYFQLKAAIFNNKKNSFEAIAVIGNQMDRATAVRCR